MLPEGARALLVEDLATDGGSKLNFINAIRTAGGKVSHALVVFHYGIFPQALDDLKKEGVSLIGLAISVYHNLLYYGIIPESIQPCTTGVSCTTRQIEWLGFITIPLLALVAFCVISAALIASGGDGGVETEVAR